MTKTAAVQATQAKYIEDFNRKKILCRRPLSALNPHFLGLDLAKLAPVETFW
jgi:hypothetical protein